MASKQPVVICVINLKGGVGKSTISALLCRHALSRRGLDVLAIDLDPQANLSQAFMHKSYGPFVDSGDPSIVEVFQGYVPPGRGNKSASVLNGSGVAKTIDQLGTKSLELIPSRFDFSDNLVSAIKLDQRVLARFLAQEFQHKDLIIIDCAPTESVFTQAAYHASGLVLIPVKPEFFATIGFPLLNKSLEGFRSKNPAHTIDVAGIVINNSFYNGGNDGGPEKDTAMKEIRGEAGKNNWKIFKNQLPCSRGFPKLMRGNYSFLGNAVLYHNFAKELFDDIGI
jgi:chromosome partitioning protein